VFQGPERTGQIVLAAAAGIAILGVAAVGIGLLSGGEDVSDVGSPTPLLHPVTQTNGFSYSAASNGWRIGTLIRADSAGRPQLDVNVVDPAGNAVSGLWLTATLRPEAHSASTETFRLMPVTEGSYSAAVSENLASGRWRVEIRSGGPSPAFDAEDVVGWRVAP
jgi:hypothetical protein